MENKEFDIAFDGFISGLDYDYAEDALFEIVYRAYAAGWTAAGKKPPQRKPPIDLWQLLKSGK